MARAEADEVEAAEEEETETAETAVEPELEPEPTPAPEAAAAPVDEKKLERAVTTYFTAISKVFGEDMGGLAACPHCVEYVPGFMPETAAPELAQAPDKEACSQCSATGFELTGSLNPESRVASCGRCNGKGWNPKAIAEPQPSNVYAYTPPAASAPWPGHNIAFVPVPGGQPDMHNRPAGHPHWGFPADYQAQSA